jgi:hypothetical protein
MALCWPAQPLTLPDASLQMVWPVLGSWTMAAGAETAAMRMRGRAIRQPAICMGHLEMNGLTAVALPLVTSVGRRAHSATVNCKGFLWHGCLPEILLPLQESMHESRRPPSLQHTGETPICKQQKVSGSTAICDHRSSIGDAGNARKLRGAILSLTLYGMISWNLSVVTVQKRKCSVSLFLLCALCVSVVKGTRVVTLDRIKNEHFHFNASRHKSSRTQNDTHGGTKEPIRGVGFGQCQDLCSKRQCSFR